MPQCGWGAGGKPHGCGFCSLEPAGSREWRQKLRRTHRAGERKSPMRRRGRRGRNTRFALRFRTRPSRQMCGLEGLRGSNSLPVRLGEERPSRQVVERDREVKKVKCPEAGDADEPPSLCCAAANAAEKRILDLRQENPPAQLPKTLAFFPRGGAGGGRVRGAEILTRDVSEAGATPAPTLDTK